MRLWLLHCGLRSRCASLPMAEAAGTPAQAVNDSVATRWPPGGTFCRSRSGEQVMAASAHPWSFRERLAPRAYWINVAIILGIRVAAAVAITYRPDWDVLRHLDYLLMLLAVMIGRRMKDFGVAPYWGWLAVAAISFVLPTVAIVTWPHPYDASRPLNVMSPIVGLITTVALLALIVAVGVRKGDARENRYGPSPG